ncbi:MAG: hypothetical protein IJE73_07185 [Muribaculaceae bacterium]|nr:hypothetical protein [Muribaculaceae bacterium]
MKKISIIVCAFVMGISACIASNSASNSFSFVSMELAAPSINVPTGVFWDGSNFIKVESSWIRICVNGSMKEYSFSTEMDPQGNYILKFNRECITISSNGRTLYYNGTSYSKK